MSLSRIVGQLQGQVAVVGERSQYHASGSLAMDTSFQHVLESEVESEGAEGQPLRTPSVLSIVSTTLSTFSSKNFNNLEQNKM
jgi:hypothetical protein